MASASEFSARVCLPCLAAVVANDPVHTMPVSQAPCDHCGMPFGYPHPTEAVRCATCSRICHHECLNVMAGQNGHCMICLSNGVVLGTAIITLSGSASSASASSASSIVQHSRFPSAGEQVRAYCSAVDIPREDMFYRPNYIQCGSCMTLLAPSLARRCATCQRLSHRECLSFWSQCRICMVLGIRPPRRAPGG